METANETEIKYDVPDGFELPRLAGTGGVTSADGPETHQLDATYYDTDELLLARHHRTLRRRTGGSDAGWHLKTPGDGASRTEHRLPLGADAETVPAELAAQVRAIVREKPLRPVARLRTRRVETPLRDDTGRTLALVAEDTVSAETDDGVQEWTELEVELVDGRPKLLTAIANLLRGAGATPAAGPSKLARALGSRLTDGRAPEGTKNPVLRYVREQRDTILAVDPGARGGDAEAIHKMRVATRRLRSTLKTFRELWAAGQVTPLRTELKWLGERLGGVRDPQVQSGRLASATDGDPDLAAVGVRLRDHLGDQLDRGRTALGAALDDTRYLRLLDQLDALVQTTPAASGNRRLRQRARTALNKADRLLAGAGGAPEHRDEHLHEARKGYKRARYAVEVFVPTVGKPAKRLVARLTAVQDALGVHQDSVVARNLLRDLAGRAHEAGENGFGYGILHARQERLGETSLDDVSAVARRARRRKARAWL
jgi:CHAD domain-containing protein